MGNCISRVLVSLRCADAPARAQLSNVMQYNNEFGCEYCLHPGVVISMGKGRLETFPFSNEKSIWQKLINVAYQVNKNLWLKDQIEKFMLKEHRDQAYYGVEPAVNQIVVFKGTLLTSALVTVNGSTNSVKEIIEAIPLYNDFDMIIIDRIILFYKLIEYELFFMLGVW